MSLLTVSLLTVSLQGMPTFHDRLLRLDPWPIP